jgi:hypothetical protein
MKEYHSPFPQFPKYRVPRLHKVIYRSDATPELVRQWLQRTMKHKYYMSPGWQQEQSVEFEDSADAVFFALTWY